jgi:hypothetical protein
MLNSIDPKMLTLIIILSALWTIPWKGVALWKAARNGSIIWFAFLLLVNTLGIIEMMYIFIFSKGKRNQNSHNQ